MDDVKNILEIGSHILNVKDGLPVIAKDPEEIW
jgi:hypothetical protein